MSQVHNINSFKIPGVCLRATPAKSQIQVFNNDQEELYLNPNRGWIRIYYGSSKNRRGDLSKTEYSFGLRLDGWNQKDVRATVQSEV